MIMQVFIGFFNPQAFFSGVNTPAVTLGGLGGSNQFKRLIFI